MGIALYRREAGYNPITTQRIYHMRSPGLVPFSIVLTFDEPAPSANIPLSSIDPTEKQDVAQSAPTFRKYTAFHLVRYQEDFDYNVYGGVGLPLTSGGHGFPRKLCKHSHRISEYDLG